ncbi:hypothetical protein PGQ11_008004 [Apiospora arundinis]|uniref:Uncharacterized protein n=1 Tax=Apiospora arundinis TaxID=335852 RepID=A0ABR2IZ84_9PEZI
MEDHRPLSSTKRPCSADARKPNAEGLQPYHDKVVSSIGAYCAHTEQAHQTLQTELGGVYTTAKDESAPQPET